VGVYALWKAGSSSTRSRALIAWSLGIGLGLGIAAVEVVPLGFYLTKSPVWGDRERERSSPWTVVKPRVLDAACTALPYLYGSQRRGQPNMAKALGVYNLNESAGGFAGLATLIWLAPLAWSARRAQPEVRFLVALTAFGLLGAFRLPPVDNLLRALPVLGVTDNRRLTLWVAFGLVSLGAIGLDRLANVRIDRGWAFWGWSWVAASVALLALASGVGQFGTSIRARALDHYARASEVTPGADREVYLARADRQTREALDFVPRYLALASAQGIVLAWLLGSIRRHRIGDNQGRAALLGLTMLDLFGFGYGLNPAIDRVDDRPTTRLIDRLRDKVGTTGRIIGLGAELPPNTLMRYGLLDARNYDSVELTRNLDWLDPLYDPDVEARSSRREITWSRVLEARDRLAEAGVRAVVAPTPPSPSFSRSEQVGSVWIAWLDARPLIESEGSRDPVEVVVNEPGQIVVRTDSDRESRVIVRQTFDPGWRGEVDGRPVEVEPYLGTFLSLRFPAQSHQVTFKYDPLEVRFALIVSSIAALVAVFTLTDFGIFRFTRIVLRRLGRTQALGLESIS